MTDTQAKKWQDHPVVIAAASVGAALVFAQTVIFPTLTASLQNEVSALRAQVQEIPALKEQIRKALEDAKSQKEKMDADAKIEKDKLTASQLNNLFSLRSPYPVGIGKVKIADSINAIAATYPEAAIDRKSQLYWSVNLDHAAIRSATYYFDRTEDLKERRIRAILFFATKDASRVLQEKLVEALGQPTAPGPKPDCYLWTVDKMTVRKDSDIGFFLTSGAQDCKINEK